MDTVQSLLTPLPEHVFPLYPKEQGIICVKDVIGEHTWATQTYETKKCVSIQKKDQHITFFFSWLITHRICFASGAIGN